jgi:hypothetical protein
VEVAKRPATPTAEEAASPAGEKVRLSVSLAPNYAHKVKSVVEVSGDLKFNGEGKEIKRLPIVVEANLLYDERVLAPTAAANAGKQPLRTVRDYHEAQAVMQINSKEVTNVLRGDRRIIGTLSNSETTALYSPFGPLTRDELDLIDIPARLSAVPSLFPAEAVAVGSSWRLTDGTLQQLLGLDAVTLQDVQATLAEHKEDVALVRWEGKVSGAVGGISTELEIKGSLNLDVPRQAVTWLALVSKENRNISHAQPGFDTVTRLRVVMQPVATKSLSTNLTDAGLKGMSLDASPGQTLLELASSKGGFVLYHDRRWRSMMDRHDVAVLRMIEKGELVTQCNVSALPALPTGEQLTLEGFQQDIQASLGKTFGQFIEAKQGLNDNKLAVMRVVVSGKVQELPIEWVYYHVADNTGRRASLVFTHAAKMAERVSGVDQGIVATFQFRPIAAAAAGAEGVGGQKSEVGEKKAE